MSIPVSLASGAMAVPAWQLRVLREPGHPGGAGRCCAIGPEGLQVGRSRQCALPLTTADRQVSRQHLQLAWQGGQLWAQVLSRLNGVVHNEQLLAPGGSAVLQVGDLLALGQSLLRVEQAPPAAAPGGHPDPAGEAALAAFLQPADAWPAAPGLAAPGPGAEDWAGWDYPPVGGLRGGFDARVLGVSAPLTPGLPDALGPGLPQDALAALQAGLGPGLPSLPLPAAPGVLYRAGDLLRVLAEGVHRLAQLRAGLRREWALAAAGDEPAADALAPLGQWLLHGDAGGGAVACREGLQAALAHERALAGAVRELLREVARLASPAAVEAELPPPDWRERWLPGWADARRWRVWCDLQARWVQAAGGVGVAGGRAAGGSDGLERAWHQGLARAYERQLRAQRGFE